MKIGLIGDIHANLPALQAVLTHASANGVTEYFNIGDLVGYNAFPEQVIQTILKLPVTSILGNYDRKVIQFPEKGEKWKKKKPGLKWLAFQWAYQQLSNNSLDFLRSLPEQLEVHRTGLSILLTHGSPAARNEYLTPQTPQHRLEELAGMTSAQVIVCGHSHVPFARQAKNKIFINTGSIGRSDDGDPRASYAVLSIQDEKLIVHHHRLPYDHARAAQAIRDQHLPEEFAQMVILGRSLDWIEESKA